LVGETDRRDCVGTEARRRRHRNADRPCARDEPLSTRRSITSDGDQTAPGIRKARAAGSSPATGHARPSRTLRPSCARARRRARHRVACPWARRPTRSHRPLPHSLACSARPGGASAGVGNESLREPHARHLIFRDRSQAGHGAFAEPSPLATDQTDDVRASGEVEVVAVSDRLAPIFAQRDRPYFSAYSRCRRRSSHQGMVVSGRSAERRTGE
jgi:hypothetical protein